MSDRSLDPTLVQFRDDTFSPFPTEAFVRHVPATSKHGGNAHDYTKANDTDEQATTERPLGGGPCWSLRFWFNQRGHGGDSLNESAVTSIQIRRSQLFKVQRAYNFRATGGQCHV